MKHITTQRRLLELVELLQEEIISPEQLAELESLVLSDPVARQIYVELVHLRDDLRWIAGEGGDHDPAHFFPIPEELPLSLDIFSDTSSLLCGGRIEETNGTVPGGGVVSVGTWGTIFSSLSGPFVFRTIFLILILAPLFMMTWVLTHPGIQEMPVLATLSRQTSDALWKEETSLLPGTSLVRGSRMQLLEGVAEIKFQSGVLLLLDGGSSLVVTGPNSAILESGTLTARVPERATGFIIKTNQSEFIDLGTEFGIRIKPDGQEEVKVFKGRVDMQFANENGSEDTISLNAGEAVQHDRGAPPKRISGNTVFFEPLYPDDQIALTDVLSGKSDFTSEPNIRIDCVAGTVMPYVAEPAADRSRNCRPEKEVYHQLSHPALLDGVFVPDGKTKISSQDTYHHFRDTSGLSHYPLIINGPIQTGAPEGKRHAILDNVDYSQPGYSFIAMHANKGITIDLNTFRHLYPEHKLTRFRAKVGNLGSPFEMAPQTPRCSADAWVLVDGKVCFVRKDFTQEDGSFLVEVDIDENSRYLTLVSTDAGNSNRYDWVIFGDPTFVAPKKIE